MCVKGLDVGFCFRVWVLGLGSWVLGLGFLFRVLGLGVWVYGFRVDGLRFLV